MGPVGFSFLAIGLFTVRLRPDGNLPFRLPLDTCQGLIGWQANGLATGLYNPKPACCFLTPPHSSLFYRLTRSVLSSFARPLASSPPSCFSLSAFSLAVSLMAPRKPTKAGSTSEDPSGLGEGWSCFLGKSLVKEADLGELVSSGVLLEGQG